MSESIESSVQPDLGALFRDGMSRIAATVHLITTDGPAGRAGLTATAVTSLSADPPMLLVHGTADVTVPLSQSETYLRIAKEKGAPCELEVVPDAPHTFDLQPKQRDLRPLVTGFFDQHLKGKSAK